MISVSWNLFVLQASFEIAKKWDLPLIVDLRDIREQKPLLVDRNISLKTMLFNHFDRSFERMVISLRNNIIKKAEAVISVSPWHVNFLSNFNKRTCLIYNGYDPEMFTPLKPVTVKKFLITYTGLIMKSEERDPSLLFQAVIKLDKCGIINDQQFRIHFYSPEKCRIHIEENCYYNLVKNYIDFFDYVDYLDVPRILNESSVCLVLTNRSGNNGTNGILTTKFFEYLGAERPVLCVKSDEGILAETIISSNIGIAARTVDEAEDYINDKWIEWKIKGYTTAEVNREFKIHFSRKTQAGQFIEIFERVLNLYN